MTTSHKTSGSMSGATTDEAKSWGKVKDDSDVATVNGDVTITFPIAMIAALEELEIEGLLKKKKKKSVKKDLVDEMKKNAKA